MFKAAEINRRTGEAAEREKEKKSWVEHHIRQEAALPIVDRLENKLETNVAQLTSNKLEVLLWWKGVPVSRMGNVANRQVLYQHFCRERRGGGNHPCPMDREGSGGAGCPQECTHQIEQPHIWEV
jgi:hypothetical protein